MKKYHIFSAIAVTIVVISWFSSKADSQNYNALEKGIKKFSIGYQADVISAFVNNDIPFYIDNEGIVKYPGKYAEKADQIIEDINSRPVVQFKDFKTASLFIFFLEKNNVDFLVRHGKNVMNIHIVYNHKDIEIVDKDVYPEFEKALIKGGKTGVFGTPKKRSD